MEDKDKVVLGEPVDFGCHYEQNLEKQQGLKIALMI